MRARILASCLSCFVFAACDPPRPPPALISETGPARADVGTRIVEPDGSQQGQDASQGFDDGGAGIMDAASHDGALPIADASGEIDTTAPFPDSGGGSFEDAAGL
jgi:hypothetical protein